MHGRAEDIRNHYRDELQSQLEDLTRQPKKG